MSEIKLIDIPEVTDGRGQLAFVETGTCCPFRIKRVFWISDVPAGQHRGGHAHLKISYTANPLHYDGNTQEWWLNTDGKGIWNEAFYYGARRFIKITENGGKQKEPCKALTRSNKCLGRLFGDWSGLLCMIWPLSPKHIEPFPHCGFTFVETGQRIISEIPND